MTRVALLLLAAALAADVSAHGAAGDVGPPVIQFNDNRTAAGAVQQGVLMLRLDAVTGTWRPEKESGPSRTVHAFAEEGRAPSIPGPLVRVREGTDSV